MIRGIVTRPHFNANADGNVVERVAALQARILPPLPDVILTLGGLVTLALSTLVSPSLVIVDTGRGEVIACNGSAAAAAAVLAACRAVEDVVERRVVPTDPAARTAGIVIKDEADVVVTSGVVPPEGQTALDAAIDGALGADNTQKSLQGTVDPLEGAFSSEAGGELQCIMVIDQLGQTFHVFAKADMSEVNPIADIVGADVLAEVAKYRVTPVEGSGAPGWFQG